MRTPKDDLLKETSELLEQIKQEQATLPWLDISPLQAAQQKIAAGLAADEKYLRRVHLQKKFIQLMQDTSKFWQGLNRNQTTPAWLSEGRARRQGKSSAPAIVNFFERVANETQLIELIELATKQNWNDWQKEFAEWQELCETEPQLRAQHRQAREELSYLLRLLRAAACERGRPTF